MQWRPRKRVEFVLGSAHRSLLFRHFCLLAIGQLTNGSDDGDDCTTTPSGDSSSGQGHLVNGYSQCNGDANVEGESSAEAQQSTHDEEDPESAGCYINGLWIPNSELHKYRNLSPPLLPPPLPPHLVPVPVLVPRFRPAAAGGPHSGGDFPCLPQFFIPSNPHYYFFFLRPNKLPFPPPSGPELPPLTAAGGPGNNTCEVIVSSKPESKPHHTSPYWTSLHGGPGPTTTTSSEGPPEPEPGVSSGTPPPTAPPLPAGDLVPSGEEQANPISSALVSPNSAGAEGPSTQASQYSYPGYAFGPSLYGTVTSVYPLPVVFGPGGPLAPSPPESLHFRRPRRRRRPRSFADFGMDHGLKKPASSPIATQPDKELSSTEEVGAELTSDMNPIDNSISGLLTPPSDLSEEESMDLGSTDSTSCTMEAKLQTSTSATNSEGPSPTVLYKDIISPSNAYDDFATETLQASMDQARPEIVSALAHSPGLPEGTAIVLPDHISSSHVPDSLVLKQYVEKLVEKIFSETKAEYWPSQPAEDSSEVQKVHTVKKQPKQVNLPPLVITNPSESSPTPEKLLLKADKMARCIISSVLEEAERLQEIKRKLSEESSVAATTPQRVVPQETPKPKSRQEQVRAAPGTLPEVAERSIPEPVVQMVSPEAQPQETGRFSIRKTLREKAHFLGVTATSPELVPQEMLETNNNNNETREPLSANVSGSGSDQLRESPVNRTESPVYTTESLLESVSNENIVHHQPLKMPSEAQDDNVISNRSVLNSPKNGVVTVQPMNRVKLVFDTKETDVPDETYMDETAINGGLSHSDILIRETELELSKLKVLTKNPNLSIYKLAYDECPTEQSENEDSMSETHTPKPVKKRPPPELVDEFLRARSEIIVHEIDNLSEAGSEDVELLPHRYESESTNKKHIYVNRLSLATELLRTKEKLPYDGEFKRVSGVEGVLRSCDSPRKGDGMDNMAFHYEGGDTSLYTNNRVSMADSGVQSEESEDEMVDDRNGVKSLSISGEEDQMNKLNSSGYRQSRKKRNVPLFPTGDGTVPLCFCCVIM